METIGVVLLAVLVEVVIEAVKPLLEPGLRRLPLPEDVEPYLYVSAVLGVGGAVLWGLDALPVLGLPPAGVVGQVVTGLIAGRGSNFVHDVIGRMGKSDRGGQGGQLPGSGVRLAAREGGVADKK